MLDATGLEVGLETSGGEFTTIIRPQGLHLFTSEILHFSLPFFEALKHLVLCFEGVLPGIVRLVIQEGKKVLSSSNGFLAHLPAHIRVDELQGFRGHSSAWLEAVLALFPTNASFTDPYPLGHIVVDLIDQLLLDELLNALLIQVSKSTVPEPLLAFLVSHISTFLRLHGNFQIVETSMTHTNSNGLVFLILELTA